MDIVKIDNFAVIKTEKEFVLVINDNIHGPFPATKEMYESICFLLENPYSEDAIERCRFVSKRQRRSDSKGVW